MDIQKDIDISRHFRLMYLEDEEFRGIYEAVLKRWCRSGERGCDSFTGSMLYELGRIRGIREERARRKNGRKPCRRRQLS